MPVSNASIDYAAMNAAPATRREQIILAAASTIDFSKCKDVAEVEKILLKRISTIDDFLRPNSLASRMIESIKIPATITDIEYEKTSTRYIVHYIADRPDSEPEYIRTDRTDGINGDTVKKMWSNLKGKHVMIYKNSEQTNDPKKPKIRVAPYVRVIPQLNFYKNKDKNEKKE